MQSKTDAQFDSHDHGFARPQAGIAAVLAVLDHAPPPAEVFAALEAGVEALVTADLVHRLIPYAQQFVGLDFTDHPWAALPAGVALCAIDRSHGRAVLSAARRAFETAGVASGCGWAYFLEGLEDLGEGDLAGADRWWARAREALGDIGPVSEFASMHRSLAAYADGDLVKATFLAEQALHGARLRSDPRIEAAAGVYLALYRAWTGEFRGVDAAARAAAEAFTRVPDPLDRYEASLVDGGYAAVAYLRGDHAGGDAHLEAGLAKAAAIQNEWYTAILLTIRAQLAAEFDATRSIRDARAALDYYERVGEHWWRHWALEAYVVAQREAGDRYASLRAARELVAVVENPLERGRALLQLATTSLALGDPTTAVPALEESVGLLEQAGARYWVARAEVLLARAQPRRTEFLLRSARRRAGAEVNDPAWRRVLRGARIELTLLGAPHAEVDGLEVPLRSPYEVRALAILALVGSRGMTVESLADALWGAALDDHVRHRVDVLIAGLRRALLPATRIERRGGRIRLDIDDDECDVRRELAAARAAIAGGVIDTGTVDAIAARLRRPLLGGVYDEWLADHQREINAVRDQLEVRR